MCLSGDMRLISGSLVFLLLMESCATLGPRTAGSSDSNSSAGSGQSSANSSAGSGNSSAGSGQSSGNSSNSGQSSNDSSANSGNSTGQSGQSSASSNNTSYHSNNSSQNSRNSSGGSTGDSSRGTTDDPRIQNSTIALAGSALLVTTGVGVGLILFLALRKPAAPEPSKLSDDAKQAQLWLRANKRQLTADLALGAGPTLDDLAAAAQIRTVNRSRFCAMLREHRAEILAPLGHAEDVSLETTVQVMSRVGALTIADPVLKADADAFMAKHPEG
jgi:hypothetical protein